MTRETAPPTPLGDGQPAAPLPKIDSKPPGVNDGHQSGEQVGVLEAMRWYWTLVLIPVVLLTCVGLTLGLLRAPVYTATANLSVDFGAESPSSLPGSITAAQALAESYSRAITATAVVSRIGKKTDAPATKVTANVSASPIPESTVVKVSGTAGSEQAAIGLANISATALTRYIGGLNGTRQGSGSVLGEFRRAENIYQERLLRQEELTNRVDSNPTDVATRQELKQARVATQVTELKKDSVGELYGASQQAYVAPLRLLSKASSASSDKLSRLELLGFVGLLAGLAIGAALATVKANRT